MKIVLAYKQEVKLYSGDLVYDTLADYAATEFKIAPSTIQLTFQDDEKDNISIHSNDDLDVMQAVFQGKQYTKITVEGTPASEIKNQPSTEKVKETNVTENSEPLKEESKT